jgi:hypothetical protein
MKLFRLAAIVAFVVTCDCVNSTTAVIAQEQRATAVFNPHRLVELGQFVRLPVVREQLQLTDDQIAVIDVHSEGLKQRTEEFTKRTKIVEDKRASYILFREEETLIRRLMDGVFSPDQLTRLKQLASQHVTRRALGSFGLLTPSIKNELGITSAQEKMLDEKSSIMADQLKRREVEMALELEKLRTKQRTDLEVLRTKMRAELVESLNPEQREAVKRLWGELVPIPQ